MGIKGHCCVERNRPYSGHVVQSKQTESRTASGPFGAVGAEDLSPSHVSDRTARLNATVPPYVVVGPVEEIAHDRVASF